MDYGLLTTSAILFVAGQLFLRMYLKNTDSAIDFIRYFGYSLVGVGLGVLIPALLTFTVFYKIVPIPPGGLMLVLIIIMGVGGFEVAKRYPSSLTRANKRNDWGVYVAFILGGFCGGTVVAVTIGALVALSTVSFWAIVLVITIVSFALAFRFTT